MAIPNIIVLDYKEDVIRWLDPELVDVEEIDAENACKKIKLTYPYENNIVNEYENQWYEQGNKIYIPEINGLKSCLYIINTDYEIDFWEDNTISFEAEEVITELNYDVIAFRSASAFTISTEQLDTWFGSYFDIGTIDTLKANRRIVTPEGVMTLMSLLRLIEEQTERTFITDYVSINNEIKRTLYLVDTNKVETLSASQILDLNYNLESLEFIKSEEKTYNAIAPIFQENTSVTSNDVDSMSSDELNALYKNISENRTNNTNTVIKQIIDAVGSTEGSISENKTRDELLDEWLEYEVETGQEIPMIIKEDENGNIVTTNTWYAPFTKNKNELFIFYEGVTRANYVGVEAYNTDKAPTKHKILTSNTSEQLVESIYNELATTLLSKLQPTFELKVDIADIQNVTGESELSYNLHDNLQVRVPGFTYYVPCKITETTKNLHHPNENSIKVETSVISVYELYDSVITSNDMIISNNENSMQITGLLTSNDEPLPDSLVTMNIKLVEAYFENNTTIQQEYKTFDPVHETYYFSENELQKLELILRKQYFDNSYSSMNYYRLRDVQGFVYEVPRKDCIALNQARIQCYINNETIYGGINSGGLGKGYFDDTIECHYYSNYDMITLQQAQNNHKLYEQTKKYYYTWFKDIQTSQRAMFDNLGLPDATTITVASEAQNGSTCLPASLSAATNILKTYHTEAELAKLMGTTTGGTNRNDASRVLTELGFEVGHRYFTEDRIKNVLLDEVVSVSVDPSKLGANYYNNYYRNTGEGSHAIIITDWYQLSGQELMLRVLDTNLPVYNPLWSNKYTMNKDEWIPFSTIERAVISTYIDGKWYNYKNKTITKFMMVVWNSDKNNPSAEDISKYIVKK